MSNMRVNLLRWLWCLLFITVIYVEAHNPNKPTKKKHSHDDGHNHDDHSHHDHAAEEDECLHLEHGEYNMSAHIMSIFILTIVSLIGSMGPLALHFRTSKKTAGNTRTQSDRGRFLIRLGILFGAGTILSTGFIHMLVPAVENLTNDCLPSLWTDDYRSFAPVFAIAGILLMQLMQHVMTMVYQKMTQDPENQTTNGNENFDIFAIHDHHHQGDGDSQKTVTENGDYSKRLTVVLLELGIGMLFKVNFDEIAIHSVIVGIALGVAREPEFYPLLIALCFHQFFEGLALGTTVIDANYKGAIKSILLTGIYGVTTPLGIAIGIFIHHSYNANSPESLLIQGIFDSVSAGILIYTALVELLTPQITNSPQFRKHTFTEQTLQFLAVWLGAAAMAIVGKFA